MNLKSTICLIVAALILLTSGCVDESVEGTTQTFTYELWVPLSVLVGGMVAGVAGWFLRDALGRFGWGLLIVGPILAVFFAPSLLLDRVVVSDTSFSQRTGIWGLTSVHDIAYDDLKMVRLTSEETRGRRGRKKTNYYLLCERKDGTEAKVPISNKVTETAAPYFLKRIAELGVPIVDQIQGG